MPFLTFGRTYNVNGPAILSGPKVASIWSQVLGKEIKFAGDSLDTFEEQMRKHSPSWAAFDIRMMFQAYLERGFVAEAGDATTLTNAVQTGAGAEALQQRLEPFAGYQLCRRQPTCCRADRWR
jgi:uncharacterized protein YbjT (DUF2867 family)